MQIKCEMKNPNDTHDTRYAIRVLQTDNQKYQCTTVPVYH